MGSPQQSSHQRAASLRCVEFQTRSGSLRLQRFDREMEHEPLGFVFERRVLGAFPGTPQRRPDPIAGVDRV
jgi:hypothetical protein